VAFTPNTAITGPCFYLPYTQNLALVLSNY
jgi:hypothetical protein